MEILIHMGRLARLISDVVVVRGIRGHMAGRLWVEGRGRWVHQGGGWVNTFLLVLFGLHTRIRVVKQRGPQSGGGIRVARMYVWSDHSITIVGVDLMGWRELVGELLLTIHWLIYMSGSCLIAHSVWSGHRLCRVL